MTWEKKKKKEKLNCVEITLKLIMIALEKITSVWTKQNLRKWNEYGDPPHVQSRRGLPQQKPDTAKININELGLSTVGTDIGND